MDTPQKKTLLALENERRYIARELHDEVAQTALQLGLQMGICRKLLTMNKPDMLAEQVAELEERVQLASAQIRALITDLRPPMVEEDSTLLDYLQHVIEVHEERGGPPVTRRNRLNGPLEGLSRLQVLTLTRIVQEALHNIQKHAQANNILLDLRAEADHLQLTIADDGQGMPKEKRSKEENKREAEAGIANMCLRAESLGGTLRIAPGTRTGQGTSVIVRIPLG